MNLNQDVEDVFAKLKTELCKLFGDTAGLHNVVDDAKTEIHALHGKMDSDKVAEKEPAPPKQDNRNTGTETPPTS